MPTKKSASPKKAVATGGKATKVEPFIISRSFDAPRPVVVRAWTEREHLMHWWGPKGVTALPGKLDLKAGGIFHYGIQMPDGKLIWGKWAIREVALPDRLVWVSSFSDEAMGTTHHPMAADWPLDILTTVAFEDDGPKTNVTVRWEPINPTPAEAAAFAAMHDSMEQGWGGSLDVLAEYLPRFVGQGQRVTPYLTVHDAAKAIDYYKTVLGAVERMRMMAEDGKRILHCGLIVNGASLLLNDAFPEHGGHAPKPGDQVPVAVALEIAAPAEVDAIYKRALDSGSTTIMAPDDTFWGGRFAMFTDPFGHRWMLNAMRPKT